MTLGLGLQELTFINSMAKGDAGGQKSGEPQCFQGLVRHVGSAMDIQGGEWLRLSLGYQQEGVPDPRWGV